MDQITSLQHAYNILLENSDVSVQTLTEQTLCAILYITDTDGLDRQHCDIQIDAIYDGKSLREITMGSQIKREKTNIIYSGVVAGSRGYQDCDPDPLPTASYLIWENGYWSHKCSRELRLIMASAFRREINMLLEKYSKFLANDLPLLAV